MTDRVAEQTARELQPAVCVVCSKALITYHCDRDHWLAPDSAGKQPSLTTPSEQCRSVGWGYCSKRPWHPEPTAGKPGDDHCRSNDWSMDSKEPEKDNAES